MVHGTLSEFILDTLYIRRQEFESSHARAAHKLSNCKIIFLASPSDIVVGDDVRQLFVVPRVEEELGVDLFRRRRQHVQVVEEEALVAEAAQVAVANHFFVALLANVTATGEQNQVYNS